MVPTGIDVRTVALAALLAVLPLGAASAAEPLDLELAFSHNEPRRWDPPDLSRDGRWLAYEVYAPPERSPGSELEIEPRILPNGTPASAVGLKLFVADVAAGTSRLVCAEGINCWRPSLSPDGSLLAYYSDVGGFPQLYMYDLASGRSRRVSEVPIKARLWSMDRAVWSPDGRRLFVPLRPGLKPPPEIDERAAAHAEGPTVTVHRTAAAEPTGAEPAPSPQIEFFISENNSAVGAVDVGTGATQVLAAADSEPRPSTIMLSPDGRWVAYFSIWRPTGEAASEIVYDVSAVPAAGGERTVFATDLAATDRTYYDNQECLWSPLGQRFVYTKNKRLWVVDFTEAGPAEPRQLADELGDLNEMPFLLTRDGDAVLVGLMPTGPKAYYHVESTQLALVPLDGGAPQVIEASGTPVKADRQTLWQIDGQSIFLLRTDPESAGRMIVRLDPVSGVESTVWRGQGRLNVSGAGPGGGSVVARFENLTTPPDYFLFGDGFTSQRRITRVEPRLDGLALGPMEMFEARIPTFDGSLVTVRPAVFLPPGAGRTPLPTIVYFYAGSQFSELAQDFGGGAPNSIPVQVFATRGYAVLFVDVPLSPEGETGGNPLEEMTDAIVAQVYQAAAKGYVDLDQVAIMGQSYGGYGTAAVISYTNLFRAGMALDGVYDLASGYGKMDPGGGSFNFIWSETGQGRMGTHPWMNLQRYLANSPYFRADRIHTPLLLVHGANDDTCPVEQAEQLFNALKRLERTAELAVYAGEGHVPGDWSLVNAVDAAERMLGWLERYMAPGE